MNMERAQLLLKVCCVGAAAPLTSPLHTGRKAAGTLALNTLTTVWCALLGWCDSMGKVAGFHGVADLGGCLFGAALVMGPGLAP